MIVFTLRKRCVSKEKGGTSLEAPLQFYFVMLFTYVFS